MSFIFDADETPEQRRHRKIAQALVKRPEQVPSNVGEGLSAIGGAIIYRKMMNDAAAAASDPWHEMRKPASGGLFGLGAKLGKVKSWF